MSISIDKCSARRGVAVAALIVSVFAAHPAAAVDEPMNLVTAGEIALPNVDGLAVGDGADGDRDLVVTADDRVWRVDVSDGSIRGPWDGFDRDVHLNRARLIIGAGARGGIRAVDVEADPPTLEGTAEHPLEAWWPRDESAFDDTSSTAAWRTDDGAVYAVDLVTGVVDEVYAPASVVIGRRAIELPTADRLTIDDGALVVHALDGDRWTLRPDTRSLPDVYAADARLFAATLGSSARESDVEVWDLESREMRHAFPHDAALVQSIAIDAAAQRIAIAQVNAVEVWDLATGKRRLQIQADSAPNAVGLIPDGLVTGHVDGGLKRWNSEGTLVGEATLPETLCQRQCRVERLVVSRDGRQVTAVTRARTAAVFELPSGLATSATPILDATYRLDPVRLALSGDGARLVVASDDGETVTFDRRDRTVVSAIPPRHGAVTHIWPSSEGRFAVLGHRSGTYSLWQLDGGLEIAPLESRRPFAEQIVAFSPSGRAMAYAHDDGRVSVIDPSTGLPILDVDVPNGVVDGPVALSWTADGTRLLVLAGGRVQLFDLAATTPSLLATHEAPEASAAVIAADGGWVAVADPSRVHILRLPARPVDTSRPAGCACRSTAASTPAPLPVVLLVSLVGIAAVWNRRRASRRCTRDVRARPDRRLEGAHQRNDAETGSRFARTTAHSP